MRTFEERIAEIDRRSQQIRNQRKQRRKHILTACVPVVLCVTACFFWWQFPDRTAPLERIPDIPETVVSESQFSYTSSVDRIEISGPGISRTLTEAAEIEKVTDYLQTCSITVVQSQSAAGSIADNETTQEILDTTTRGNSTPNGTIADCANTEYTVTFSLSGEEPVRYYLTESTIQNIVTGEIHILTPVQSNHLFHLLGLSYS